MQIELQRVAPTFIESEKIAASHIWNQQLVFQPGEKIQVVAPSGSGKTSFIHFLYGMRKDYSGTVSYNNQDIKSFNAETFAVYRQQHISIVFQDLRLFAEQTVWQNLEIKRQLNPFHSQSKIEGMARQLGIEGKLNKPCKTCSYGEQQRIAIIRALQQPFEYLLLDEPLSHLDQVNREKVMDLIAEEVSLRQAAVILADLKPTDYFKADKTINL